jgi:excisionase family DNA binding protein
VITVPEAARRVNRDPETIRRWIRSGKLPAQKFGTQHVIEEADLLSMIQSHMLPLPEGWRVTVTGEPMPDVVIWIERSRQGH